MKNIKQLFAATTLASLMAVAGQANADSVSFWDHLVNVDVKLRENGVGIGDKYELIQIGLNPSLYAGATINSVNLKIWLSDDADFFPAVEVAQIESHQRYQCLGSPLTSKRWVSNFVQNVEYDLDVTSFFSASGTQLHGAAASRTGRLRLPQCQADHRLHAGASRCPFRPRPGCSVPASPDWV
jgi:hypothetical protein